MAMIKEEARDRIIINQTELDQIKKGYFDNDVCHPAPRCITVFYAPEIAF